MAAFQGERVLKIACCATTSFALTYSGRVFSWGSGVALGHGNSIEQVLEPRIISMFNDTNVIDISAGDRHCLALTDQGHVYAWGDNAMGQCGLGHSNSPVTKPQRVDLLQDQLKEVNGNGGGQANGVEKKVKNEVSIQQISAGTSHSIVWTCPPKQSRPLPQKVQFCIDVTSKCFDELKYRVFS